MSFDASGFAPFTIARPGKGVADGYSEYFGAQLWGEYGGSAVDEQGNIYVAGQYIESACTYEQYMANGPDAPTRCNGTRTATTNWATAIVSIKPTASAGVSA